MSAPLLRRRRLAPLIASLARRLRYVSITTKVLLLPALTLAAFAVYFLFTLGVTRLNTATLDRFAADDLPLLSQVNAAHLALVEVQAAFTQAVGDRDEFLLDEALETAAQARPGIAQIVDRHASDRAAAGLLDRWDRYVQSSRIAFEHVLTGDVDLSTLQLLAADKQRHYHAIRNELATLASRSEASFHSALAEASQRSNRSLVLGIAIVAALSLLTIGVSLLVNVAIAEPIARLKRAIGRVARGDFSVTVAADGSDAVAAMCAAFNNLLADLQAAITETNRVLAALGQGDFSQRVRAVLPGDLGRLKAGVNASADSLQRTMQALAEREAGLRAARAELEQRVEQRTRELAVSEQRFRTLASAAPIGICLADNTGAVLYTNPYWQKVAGQSSEESLRLGWYRILHPDDAADVIERWQRAAEEERPFEGELRFRRPDGEVRLVRVQTNPVRDAGSGPTVHVATVQDITENKRIAAELQQAQKLEAVGRLAAGVAHEINTPVQFVSDSCHFLRDAIRDLEGLIACYREVLDGLAGDRLTTTDALAQLHAANDDADLDYLLENMPGAAESALEGLGRVSTIVRSMKEFAHPDQKEMAHADLNRAIESTLTIAGHEYKYVADVETDFGELPPVCCYLSDFNQAVLNIVVNAAHAIADVVGSGGGKGSIRVSTRQDGDNAVISIQDTGGGIPEAVRDKIFDPFFTTKEVGKGTGQGLAIVRSVIVDKHRGSVAVDSTIGYGTTFTLRIPISPAR